MFYKIYSKNSNKANFIRSLITSKLDWKYKNINPDVIIVIGGDGTFLRAINELGNKYTYLFISTGKIGHYSSISFKEIEAHPVLIKNIISETTELPLLSTIIQGKEYIALNEIRILSLEAPLYSDIKIKNQDFGFFIGSEIYFCTSTGSTGYNHSLNGPIFLDQSDYLINFIAKNKLSPANLSNPILLPGNIECELNIDNNSFFIIIDNKSFKLLKNNNIKIKYAHKHIKLLVSSVKELKNNQLRYLSKTLSIKSSIN